VAWPARELSPNVRAHWSAVARARRVQRAEAHLAALVAQRALDGASWAAWRAWTGPLQLGVILAPPDARRRDQDNLLAALKGAIDGVAHALTVDDSRIQIGSVVMTDPVARPHVILAVGLPGGAA
jgi:crossover junction endodeoxyribonuclease RusA